MNAEPNEPVPPVTSSVLPVRSMAGRESRGGPRTPQRGGIAARDLAEPADRRPGAQHRVGAFGQDAVDLRCARQRGQQHVGQRVLVQTGGRDRALGQREQIVGIEPGSEQDQRCVVLRADGGGIGGEQIRVGDQLVGERDGRDAAGRVQPRRRRRVHRELFEQRQGGAGSQRRPDEAALPLSDRGLRRAASCRTSSIGPAVGSNG